MKMISYNFQKFSLEFFLVENKGSLPLSKFVDTFCKVQVDKCIGQWPT